MWEARLGHQHTSSWKVGLLNFFLMGIMKKESMKTNGGYVYEELLPNVTVWKKTQVFVESLVW